MQADNSIKKKNALFAYTLQKKGIFHFVMGASNEKCDIMQLGIEKEEYACSKSFPRARLWI